MAEQEVAKRKINLQHSGTRGQRFLFDASGKQHLFGPGQEGEVELTEPEAKRMEEASKAGSDMRVKGFEPEKKERLEEAPEIPKEQETRAALAEAERDLMEAGQEGDKERREKIAKMDGPQVAAETGIRMYARGLSPEVIGSPPDAPPKKKEKA